MKGTIKDKILENLIRWIYDKIVNKRGVHACGLARRTCPGRNKSRS